EVDVGAVELGEGALGGADAHGLEVFHADDAEGEFATGLPDGVAILAEVAAGAADEDGAHGDGVRGGGAWLYCAPPIAATQCRLLPGLPPRALVTQGAAGLTRRDAGEVRRRERLASRHRGGRSPAGSGHRLPGAGWLPPAGAAWPAQRQGS